jgi:hypothetical protein
VIEKILPEPQNIRRSHPCQSTLPSQEYSYIRFVVLQIAHHRLGEACATSDRGFRRYWHEAQLIVRGSTGDWHPWLHSLCGVINSKSFVLIILFRNLNDFMSRIPMWVLAVELNVKTWYVVTGYARRLYNLV